MQRTMFYPSILAKRKADQDLRNLKIKVKGQGNTKAGLEKIRLAEYLKKVTMNVTGEIAIRRAKLSPYQNNERKYTVKQFLNSDGKQYSSAQGLAKALNTYTERLKEKLHKYVQNTTPWGERYIKLIPPSQRKQKLSFGDFYFKNATRDEAILILYTFELDILKEASEILEQISKDN